MPAGHRTAWIAALCCCLAAGVARAQQQAPQPTRFDVTHCYVAELSAIEGGASYRALGLRSRGIVRAEEAGGPFDNYASRCIGTLASVGGGPAGGSGYCEWAGSPEDQVLIRWTIEAGRGGGRLVGGTGRYRGISGELSYQRLPPIPSPEPGVLRVCNRTSGAFRLP